MGCSRGLGKSVGLVIVFVGLHTVHCLSVCLVVPLTSPILALKLVADIFVLDVEGLRFAG